MYEIRFKRSAAKELGKLPPKMQRKILQAIEALANDPRPHGSRKLVNWEDFWRIRIGDYRVIYQIKDNQLLIQIIGIRHRKDAYR